MKVEELTRRIDDLLEAANEAGSDYDTMAFGTEELPPSDFRTSLGANLSFLQDELAQLSMDLRTLPVEV